MYIHIYIYVYKTMYINIYLCVPCSQAGGGRRNHARGVERERGGAHLLRAVGHVLASTVLSVPYSGLDCLVCAILWPLLSYMCHILALTVLCVP